MISISDIGCLFYYGFLFSCLALVVYRITYQYYKIWYYTSQGIPFASQNYPLLGHVPPVLKIMRSQKTNDHPGTIFLEQVFGKDQPSMILVCPSYKPALFIRNPKVLEELYTKHNKHFDKDVLIRDVLYPLMGDSIL